jgi:hypothetical protein
MCDLTAEQPDCRCRQSVLNGYQGMKRCGAADSEAMTAACRIFSFHHPEVAPDASRLTVERWIYTGFIH